jgi:CHAT domain-containing protein
LAFAGANSKDGHLKCVATAYELMGMDLWGTQIVTLSACETGLGGETVGQGVRGLQQSFLAAGARTVVVSLWRVPDKDTTTLMTAFYERVLKGERAAAALRQAMLAVRAQRKAAGQSQHPLHWGGFILIGDPGPAR